MQTKVSVVIPVYNEPELVIKAIKSVPVREDVEIIVVDDCSTDDTMERVAEYFCEEDLFNGEQTIFVNPEEYKKMIEEQE